MQNRDVRAHRDWWKLHSHLPLSDPSSADNKSLLSSNTFINNLKKIHTEAVKFLDDGLQGSGE